MASRNPNLLAPKLKAAWAKMDAMMDEAGYDAFLTCTHRSNEEQAELYAQGRTKSGKILTRCKPGKSRHNSLPAMAFDIAISVGGKLDWNTKGPAWKRAVEIGNSLGLINLRMEDCHFQLP